MMHHLYFFAVPLGTAAVVAVAVSYRAFRSSNSANRPLSGVINELMKQVTEDTERDKIEAQGRREVLPLGDAWSLYSNSRSNLVRAHRLLLDDETHEMQVWLEKAEETHSSLAKTLVFSQAERIFGGLLKMRFPLYTRACLGLFADEEWILTEMMQRRLELLQERFQGAN